MRNLLLLLPFMLFCATVELQAARGGDDGFQLQGVWKGTDAEGNEVSFEFGKGDKCAIEWVHPKILSPKAKYQLDLLKKPAWLDIEFDLSLEEMPEDYKDILAVSLYVIDNDHVRLYLTELVRFSEDRPLAFSYTHIAKTDIIELERKTE